MAIIAGLFGGGATGPVRQTPAAPPGSNYTPPPGAPTPGAPTSSPSGQLIPDAGVYGAESAAALKAYQEAQAQLLAQRNALYNQQGMLDNGQVDPNNPYGEYQQMLGSEGAQLDADLQNAAARNVQGGLAHQQESRDKAAQAGQNFQFQNQVKATGANYLSGMAQAKDAYNMALSQAQSDALQVALSNMMSTLGSGGTTGYTNYNGPQIVPSTLTSSDWANIAKMPINNPSSKQYWKANMERPLPKISLAESRALARMLGGR